MSDEDNSAPKGPPPDMLWVVSVVLNTPADAISINRAVVEEKGDAARLTEALAADFNRMWQSPDVRAACNFLGIMGVGVQARAVPRVSPLAIGVPVASGKLIVPN